MGRIVNEDGTPTQEEQTFRSALLNLLQTIAGTQGLVAPTVTAAEEAVIVAGTSVVPSPLGDLTTYTCQYGTIVYNSTANSMRMAVNNGSNQPIFKTVTLT